MVAGIYRPRFRVANPKNDGVIRAWSRIREGNAEAIEFVQAIRAASGLEPFPMPIKKAKPEAEKAVGQSDEAATAKRVREIDALIDALARDKSVRPDYED